jgi:hypothetical protein
MPEGVRYFVQSVATIAAHAKEVGMRTAQFRAFEWGMPVPRPEDTEQAKLDLPKVASSCARCGQPIEFDGRRLEKCASCGTEIVADRKSAALIFRAGSREIERRRALMRGAALRLFPTARLGLRGYRCGDCSTRLEIASENGESMTFELCEGCGKRNAASEEMSMTLMLEAVARAIDHPLRARIIDRIKLIEIAERRFARRSQGLALFGHFVLIVMGIALFCYVGYRIDVATQEPVKAPQLKLMPPLPSIDWSLYPDVGTGDADKSDRD